jgi:hypothetical protein
MSRKLGSRGYNHKPSGGFEDAAALDADGADFDSAHTPCLRVENGTHGLQIWQECTGSDSGHVLADTALFLGLTASVNDVSTDRALATNFTASRHVDILR